VAFRGFDGVRASDAAMFSIPPLSEVTDERRIA
jgi:hypothetical protein